MRFKKLFSVLITISLFVNTWLYSLSSIAITTQSTAKIILGDTNNDSELDIRDLIKLKTVLSENITVDEKDINGDGICSAKDLICLKYLLLYSEDELAIHTVTFTDADGSIISRQYVKHSFSAITPPVQDKTDYEFVGWSENFHTITKNTVISAIYTKKAVVDQNYNPESENAQSGTAVEEAISTKIDNSTIVTKKYSDLKTVSVAGVAEEQNIDVKLSSKNLLLLPYDNGFDQVIDNLFTTEPVTKNGVTFKPNADGSITIWGTPTATTNYYLRNYYKNASTTARFTLSSGNYIMSIQGDTLENLDVKGCIRFMSSATSSGFAYIDNPLRVTLDEEKAVAAFISISTLFSATEDNPIIVYPQIEVGNEVTPFTSPLYKGLNVADEPTFEGTNLTVSEVGKDDVNLSAETGVVQATVSNDFTISINKQFYIDLDVKTKVIGAVTNKIEQTASASLGISPLRKKADSLKSGDSLTLEANMCKKNKQLTFYAKVDTMGEFILYHGKEIYNSGVVIIDDTNVTVKTYSTSYTERFTGAHGLTISDYIGVVLTVDNSNKLSIKIITSSGIFEKDNIYWSSSQGEIGVESTSAELSNISISWNSDDYKKPIWIYGDSYLDFENKARWCTWMRTWGFDNCLAEGFPGAESKHLYPDFINSLNHGTPKYAVWCLGMNDEYLDWLNYVEQFISVCEEKGIEPILATIPNVPLVDNSSKNDYVRTSGYRYIDFAIAVGAEEPGSTWYEGMLHSDNVHPTEAGAKALAVKALTDVPELMQK